MNRSKNNQPARGRWIALAAVGLLIGPMMVQAGEIRWDSAGIRAGIPATSRGDKFVQAELFGRLDLPWAWKFCRDWKLQTQWDVSAGWLTRDGNNGFVGSTGPCLVLGAKGFPVALDVGSSPTILGTHEFGPVNFGVPLQFTSHFGLLASLGPRVILGYRFQHMSNAKQVRENPGLDLHLISLGYRF